MDTHVPDRAAARIVVEPASIAKPMSRIVREIVERNVATEGTIEA